MMTPRLPSNRVGQNAESRVQMSPLLPNNSAGCFHCCWLTVYRILFAQMAVHILIFPVLPNVKRLEKRANRINGEWGFGGTDKVQ